MAHLRAFRTTFFVQNRWSWEESQAFKMELNAERFHRVLKLLSLTRDPVLAKNSPPSSSIRPWYKAWASNRTLVSCWVRKCDMVTAKLSQGNCERSLNWRRAIPAQWPGQPPPKKNIVSGQPVSTWSCKPSWQLKTTSTEKKSHGINMFLF